MAALILCPANCEVHAVIRFLHAVHRRRGRGCKVDFLAGKRFHNVVDLRRRCTWFLTHLPKSRSIIAGAGPSLQFCQRQVFHRKFTDQGCSSTKDWIGAIACSFFPHPTLSLASEQTLKDLKRSQGAPAWRWGEWIWLTEPSELHRNSPKGLNIGSTRVFDQFVLSIRILITIHWNFSCLTAPKAWIFGHRFPLEKWSIYRPAKHSRPKHCRYCFCRHSTGRKGNVPLL